MYFSVQHEFSFYTTRPFVFRFSKFRKKIYQSGLLFVILPALSCMITLREGCSIHLFTANQVGSAFCVNTSHRCAGVCAISEHSDCTKAPVKAPVCHIGRRKYVPVMYMYVIMSHWYARICPNSVSEYVPKACVNMAKTACVTMSQHCVRI